MLRIQISLFIALSISTADYGQTQEPKTNQPTEKTVEWNILNEAIFEIKYPSDWEVSKSGQMGTSFIIFSPLQNEADNFRENVNLLIQDLNGYNVNLEQYVEISEGQIKTMVTEGKIISSERKKEDEREYQKIIYTGKQGIFVLKFEQYYWVIENQAYVLTLTSKEKEFEQYQEIGEKILNSFQLK